MDRLILVSYLERNKVFHLPSSSSEVADLTSLEEQFRRDFKFGCNVGLDITFQRFDGEWEQYIDLEKDTALFHKDRLKAVVTPMLTTPRNTPEVSPKL